MDSSETNNLLHTDLTDHTDFFSLRLIATMESLEF